jgi:DNA-binding transcriptional regulator YiaG
MGIKMNENNNVTNGQNERSDAPSSDGKTTWTYRDWYERNKEALSKKRKERYHNNKEYREKVLDQNKEYRAKKAKEKPSQPKAKIRTPKHRKPVQMEIVLKGKIHQLALVHVGAFARAIGRSVPTIHQWERVGLLPKTPFLLHGKNKHERLYSAEMIGVVRTALSTRGATVSSSDQAFYQEIVDGWAALGVVVEE